VIPEPPIPAGVEPRLSGWYIVVVRASHSIAWESSRARFGYYDRFLGGLPEGVPRVGLAWAGQLVPVVPIDAWTSRHASGDGRRGDPGRGNVDPLKHR